MRISFIILFMIVLYRDSHVRAYMRLLTFSFKKTSQKLLTGFLPNFTRMFLRYRLKTSLHRYRKNRPVKRFRRSSASSFQKATQSYAINSLPENDFQIPGALFENNV